MTTYHEEQTICQEARKCATQGHLSLSLICHETIVSTGHRNAARQRRRESAEKGATKARSQGQKREKFSLDIFPLFPKKNSFFFHSLYNTAAGAVATQFESDVTPCSTLHLAYTSVYGAADNLEMGRLFAAARSSRRRNALSADNTQRLAGTSKTGSNTSVGPGRYK